MNRVKGRERAEIIAAYVIETKATVRSCAARFGVSKSTVHKDLTERIRYSNPNLYNEVKLILELNKQERHLRGGEATKRKFLIARMNKKK